MLRGCVLTYGSLFFWTSRELFFPFTKCDLSLVISDPQSFSTLLSTTILIRGELTTHKLPSWWQCNGHWHTLKQPSIEPKLSLFFGTPWYCWCQLRLGLHIKGPTWQCLPTAYTYLAQSSSKFDMSWLMRTTIVSASVTVYVACSLKVSFPSNHNPIYFRVLQSLISYFRWNEGELNQQRCVNNTTSIFV